jgi:hypothetical protein
MDHTTTLWLAHERTVEARQQAAEHRRARTLRRRTPARSLLARVRNER